MSTKIDLSSSQIIGPDYTMIWTGAAPVDLLPAQGVSLAPGQGVDEGERAWLSRGLGLPAL